MKFTMLALLLLVSAQLQASTFNFFESSNRDLFEEIQKTELLEIVEDENGNEVEVLLEEKSKPKFLDLFAKNQGVRKVGIGNVIMVTTDLIALGVEIYKIIEAGRPVVNVESEPVSVLPNIGAGTQVSAFDLEGWKTPVVKKYRFRAKNYLGMSPVSFDYMLIYTYGGKYQGKGKYITGAQIKPSNIDVKWGYSLDAAFKVQTIINQGSYNEPLAAVVLSIDYKVSTVLQDKRHSRTFFINGNGNTIVY